MCAVAVNTGITVYISDDLVPRLLVACRWEVTWVAQASSRFLVWRWGCGHSDGKNTIFV